MSAQLTAPYKIACPWEAAIHRQARTTVAIAALALWTAATAVRAEAPPPFRLLFAPSATSWNSWGSSARDGFRADPAVRGQTAYRVVVSAPGAHPWDAGATILTDQAMRQGDRLIAAFWARADGAGGGHVRADIQNTTAPYTEAAGTDFDIDSHWRLYQIRGAAPFAAAAGQMQLVVQLGARAQVIELGPAYLMDLGAGAPAEPTLSPSAVERLAATLNIGGSAEDLVVDNAAAKVKLAATLRKPAGAGPFPLVVFITGHGPFARVGASALTKAFLSRGVATLSYDKRGVGASTGDFASASMFDLMDDAASVVAYAKHRPDIDATRITLIGASEGGTIAPAVAAREPVAFLVLQSAPAERLAGLYLYQLSQAPPAPAGSDFAKQMAVAKAIWTVYADARDPTDACDRGKATLHSAAAKGEVTSANLATGLGQVCDPALLRAALYDPALVLKQLSLPTLVIAGALDLQVPPDRNLPIIRAAMADNPDLTVIEFPGLNHLLRYAKTGGAEEWTAPGGPTDDAPEMVEVVADWVARHAAAKAGP